MATRRGPLLWGIGQFSWTRGFDWDGMALALVSVSGEHAGGREQRSHERKVPEPEILFLNGLCADRPQLRVVDPELAGSHSKGLGKGPRHVRLVRVAAGIRDVSDRQMRLLE